MFRFQHIEYLWLLLLVPLVVVVYIAYLQWRSSRIKRLGDPALVKNLLSGRINGRITTKFVLVTLALLSAILGLANLQMGAQTEKAERKGVDVFFALDVSKSMLARDIQPDRLSRAKMLIAGMMDKMKNDRVGLVVFAGKAYLQVPLTIDYSAARMLLETVKPDLIPTQGTVLSEAINLANTSFSQKEKKHKAIVLISDGEDHDEQALDAAKKAADQGVIIYTVGIGSPQGATIIDPETGEPKLDENGNPVITKLNEEELKSLAQATGGTYKLLANTNQVADYLTDLIDNMEGKNMGMVMFTDYSSYFQYFIGAALLLLIADWLLPAATIFKKKSTIQSTGVQS
ncbi:VWA domain-containing protein [Taibaiella chishuiensis]|uniref:Ca-activated chloride channel family protein n=1 Tax=Taibaiella chishuiensis TaxID=1434707 RepID=A0A2P8DD14_9BACT|nr:VWA domain-containing protein [Taibaiella chishuiensis]PSK95085.1 Ca-activated chloride channel family protein [Taibaiella chishuiensis]